MTTNATIEIVAKANLKALQRVVKTLDAIDSRMAHVSQALEKMSSGFSKADGKVAKTGKQVDKTKKSVKGLSAALSDAEKNLLKSVSSNLKAVQQIDKAAVKERAKLAKSKAALDNKLLREKTAAEKRAAREASALRKKEIAEEKAAHRKKAMMLKQRMALIRNSNRAEQAAHNARRARLSEMSGALSGVNQHLKSLSRGFAVMSIASTAAILAVTKVSKDFEASLVRSATVATGTSNDFESNFSRMSKSAIDLANQTEHTAAAVGEGMNFMAMAGFNASDIISAMPTVAKLATAANLSMADSANIVTNAMAGFGITSDKIMEEFEADTGKVMSRTRATEILAQKTKDAANVLVGAFTSSNVSLTDLNESLKIAGPVAKQLNIPIEDLAATIGLLGNVGVRGTAAGTGLKRAMVAMVKPSKQAAVAMGKLGISSDMVSGKDGFLKVVAALEAQRDKMKETGREALFLSRVFKVFAERAGPQMAALVAQGTQSLVSLSSGIEKAKQEDLASIIEERQLNTLSGALNKLVSNIRTFAKELGDTLLPGIKELVKDFEDAAVGARNLDDRIKDFMVTAAKVGAFGGGMGFVAVKILDVAASLTIASLGFQQLAHVTKMTKMAMVAVAAKGVLAGGILVGAFAGTLAIMEDVSGKTYDIAGAFENAFAESTESIKNMFINLFQFIASMITWVLAPLKLFGLDLEKRLNDFLLDTKDLVIDVTIDDAKLNAVMKEGVLGELPKDKEEAKRKAQDIVTGGMVQNAKKALELSIAIDKEDVAGIAKLQKKIAGLAKKVAKAEHKGQKSRKKQLDAELDSTRKQLKAALALRKVRQAEAKQRMSAEALSAEALSRAKKSLFDKEGRAKGEVRTKLSAGGAVVTTTSGAELFANLEKAIPAQAEALSRQITLQAELARKGDEKAKPKVEVPDFVAAAEDATAKLKSLAKELENLTNKIADSIRAYDKSFLAFENSAKSLDLKLRMEGSEFKAVNQEMLKLMGDIEGIASGKDNLKAMAKQIRALQLNEIELKRNTLALQKDKLTPEKEEELNKERSRVDDNYTTRMDEVDEEAKKLAGTFVDLRIEGLAEKLSKVEASKRSEALAEAFEFLQETLKETDIELKKSKLVEAIADTAKKADEAALEWDKVKVIDPQVEIKGVLQGHGATR